ncbi:MAG: FAD-binding protein, partial [Deltaproteobacteria bacterium]|nr:FAD-binding protein [Deltaproteobacteria bacterium]
KNIESDVLIIGGGIAGCFAAIKAKDCGLDVVMVDKGHIGKIGSSAFAGGYYGVFNPDWGHDFDASMKQICQIGEYINHQGWMECVLKESYDRYKDLISWGIDFVKNEDGTLFKNRRGALECLNLFRRKYMPVLREKVIEKGIQIVDRIMTTDLITCEDRVMGAVGFHTRTGDFYIFRSKATVIAAGTGGFKQGSMPTAFLTADGDTMAYRAGAEITGKEFSFGERSAGVIADSPAWRGHGMATVRFAKYITAEGEEVIFRKGYYPGIRDTNPAYEVHAGRGPIYWNLNAANEEDIASMKHHQKATGTDLETERIGLDVGGGGKIPMVGGAFTGSGVHGGSSGICPVDTTGASSLQGLFAAGDGCGSMQSGATFPGPESGLRDASVTGARAGQSAGEYALKTARLKSDTEEIARLKEVVYVPIERKGGFTADWVTQQLQNIMLPYYVWLVKHGDRMQAALTQIEFISSHIVPKLTAKDPHELRMAHESKSMALNAQMMLQTSMFRKESRGSHYREDYPRRDDPAWLAWVKLKKENDTMKVWKQPIPKEWWPDLSIPYEERYPNIFPGE